MRTSKQLFVLFLSSHSTLIPPRYFYSLRSKDRCVMVLSNFDYDGWKMSPTRVNLDLNHILVAGRCLFVLSRVCECQCWVEELVVNSNGFEGSKPFQFYWLKRSFWKSVPVKLVNWNLFTMQMSRIFRWKEIPLRSSVKMSTRASTEETKTKKSNSISEIMFTQVLWKFDLNDNVSLRLVDLKGRNLAVAFCDGLKCNLNGAKCNFLTWNFLFVSRKLPPPWSFICLPLYSAQRCSLKTS